MKTEFAITPERQTPGSDLDTFYDPNDDVVVSGTAGNVMLGSWRFAQWSEGQTWGYSARQFRRDVLAAAVTIGTPRRTIASR